MFSQNRREAPPVHFFFTMKWDETQSDTQLWRLKSSWPLFSSIHTVYGVPHTHMLLCTTTASPPPLRSTNSPPPLYQQQIISTYCIVANGQTIPGLIGCLSDFVFVLLCPCFSIKPYWLQSSQPGEWFRQEWQLAAKMGQILYLSGTSWINWDFLNGTRKRNIVKSCRMQNLRIRLIQECVIYVGRIRCHVSAVGEEGSLKVRKSFTVAFCFNNLD